MRQLFWIPQLDYHPFAMQAIQSSFKPHKRNEEGTYFCGVASMKSCWLKEHAKSS